MTGFWRSLLGTGAGPAAPELPRHLRVYAVGDIHGRSDLLDLLLDKVNEDIDRRTEKRPILVFLGDYIDRGPDSAGVIQRLVDMQHSDREAYFLLGNHEEALLRILNGDSGLVGDWLKFGGHECLESYGADAARIAMAHPDDAQQMIVEAIPAAHRAFLDACEDSVTIGGYFFVHAGVRPGIPLELQAQRDLRWIREPFLGSEEDHGKVIVHGHSIREEVDIRTNRIGIDTGAYRTGVLTALVLSASKRRTLQATVRPDTR